MYLVGGEDLVLCCLWRGVLQCTLIRLAHCVDCARSSGLSMTDKRICLVSGDYERQIDSLTLSEGKGGKKAYMQAKNVSLSFECLSQKNNETK